MQSTVTVSISCRLFAFRRWIFKSVPYSLDIRRIYHPSGDHVNEPAMKQLIQVAGIRDAAEAQMVLACGVHCLGFPLRLAVHHEEISDDAASEIIRSLTPPHRGVLITYLDTAREIDSLCRFLGTRHVQVHGSITIDEIRSLRQMHPGIRIVKSLIIRGNNLAALKASVHEFSPHVDAFITDTYDPSTGACGATGKTHDWQVSRLLVGISHRPVILAGGLTPKNVRNAIREVKPAGVDTHTGVEDATHRKNREMVQMFVSEAREGFRSIS